MPQQCPFLHRSGGSALWEARGNEHLDFPSCWIPFRGVCCELSRPWPLCCPRIPCDVKQHRANQEWLLAKPGCQVDSANAGAVLVCKHGLHQIKQINGSGRLLGFFVQLPKLAL